MATIKMQNGASVHRAWGDGGSEFLACFQYSADASEYAGSKLLDDADRGWFDSFYIITDHNDGSLTISRHSSSTQSKEAA